MPNPINMQSKFRTCPSGHPQYQTFFCPECARINLTPNTPNAEYMYHLGILSARINEVFLSPTIGKTAISAVIDHCLSLSETHTFLSPYTPNTIAYNLARIQVFQIIKTAMNAWVDDTSIPSQECEIPE